MTEQRQAELIAAACKEAGLDGHIRWIESKKQADTWAEKIAMRFKGSNSLPVKNSYMYCDTLDMRFFFWRNGIALHDICWLCHRRKQGYYRGKIA